MYGYVVINDKTLSEEEKKSYKACYCGLCNILYKKYKRVGQFTLTNDMTFLIYLLNSLYEPEIKEFDKSCIAHPFKGRHFAQSSITEYAADMNILLAWYKLEDDWEDEKKISAKFMMAALKKAYLKLKDKYSKKAKRIEEAFKELSFLEKASCDKIDLVASAFGKCMEEIFDYKGDIWSDDLRKVGFFLGKFVYIMDAYQDMEEDKKRGEYNCLLLHLVNFENDSEFIVYINSLLNVIMAECARAFERLPLIENVEVLRNVIYAGVWTAWDQMHTSKEETKDDK